MSNNEIYNYLCKKFENDNLKVEKYNVFLKNEKNNQYNVKK